MVLVSRIRLKRWKVYVGYEANSALPPSKVIFLLNQYVGCGKLPTANEDIVESIKVGNFNFNDPLDHLKIRLKPDLQEGKDYEFIGKEMAYSLAECEDYEIIKVARRVIKTK